MARFFLNSPSAGLLAAVDPRLWASLTIERELVEGKRLGLGFDGSHSQDGTALVGCTEDGRLFRLEIIERPPNLDEWRVDRSRIDRALEHAFDTYDVAYLYADPWKWQDELQDWSASWPGRIVEWPTNSSTRQAPTVDRFRTALEQGRLHHDGDPDLTRHVLNARLRKVGRDEDGRGRYTLEKAGPGGLIDACVATVLAVEAAAQMPAPKADPFFEWA